MASCKVHPIAKYDYSIDARTGRPHDMHLWDADGKLRLYVRFYDDAAPALPPELDAGLESGTCYLKMSTASILIDMVRNEAPVSVTLYDQDPGYAYIQTGLEPAGVGDEDAAARTERVDQANEVTWTGGAIHVSPEQRVSQTFVPSLPRLHAVEFQLQPADEGKGGDTLTLTILTSSGRVLCRATETLAEGTEGAQRFALPGGGINVVPGVPLTMMLQDTGKAVFFWKYVSGNPYLAGEAMFNGAPFGTNDFLFRTFGAFSA